MAAYGATLPFTLTSGIDRRCPILAVRNTRRERLSWVGFWTSAGTHSGDKVCFAPIPVIGLPQMSAPPIARERLAERISIKSQGYRKKKES
jgi:hypothetical protein